MLHLVVPQLPYFETVKRGALACLAEPTPYDIQAMKKLEEAVQSDFETYLKKISDTQKGINLPAGYVADTILWLMDDDEFVGLYDIRHSLTDGLRMRGGHIAYQIVPKYRHKGYVKAGLKLLLAWARENLQLNQALLTCHGDNIASYCAMSSVMQEYGGMEDPPVMVEGHLEKRVWINTKKEK